MEIKELATTVWAVAYAIAQVAAVINLARQLVHQIAARRSNNPKKTGRNPRQD